MSHITNNWQEANQRYLWVALLCGSETVDKRAVAVAVCTNWNWG